MSEETGEIQNKKPVKEQKGAEKLIALKDFKFAFGKDVYEIKKGDEIKVPAMFLANLKTEQVI